MLNHCLIHDYFFHVFLQSYTKLILQPFNDESYVKKFIICKSLFNKKYCRICLVFRSNCSKKDFFVIPTQVIEVSLKCGPFLLIRFLNYLNNNKMKNNFKDRWIILFISISISTSLHFCGNFSFSSNAKFFFSFLRPPYL